MKEKLSTFFTFIIAGIVIATPIWVVILGAIKLFGDPDFSWVFVFAPVLLGIGLQCLYQAVVLLLLLLFALFK